MLDQYGREINYMRISITDRCNLRCRYCMPIKKAKNGEMVGGAHVAPMSDLLSYEEIVRVCQVAVSLGITRFKVTGGEPLVRKNCDKLIKMICDQPGVEEVTLTTNGILLKEYAKSLYEAGLRKINVSLDTLDAEKYQKITGFDKLSHVLEGIEEAIRIGMIVKINTVLTRDNADFVALLSYGQRVGAMVRFIEVMPIGYGKVQDGISNEELLRKMELRFGKPELCDAVQGNGPAVYYMVPGFQKLVGFISAIHGKFCNTCNRIRMTAQGEVKACLCFETTVSLREELRKGNMEQVKELLELTIFGKPREHVFEDTARITENKKMIEIGG